MKRTIASIFIILGIAKFSYAVDEIEIIRNRIISNLLQSEVNESNIKNLLATIREDGTWPGINYEDVSRTGFQHGQHLSNMVELSRAYKKKGSKFRRNNQVRKAINASLNYWLANDFICDNWWWNQIGTPGSLVHVLLIMDSDLTGEQISKAAPMIGRAHLNASGARPSGDRIKIAGILAKHLLFQRDQAQFDEVIRVIENEIKFSNERGMQYDYSFHHRVDRVNNTLSYGLGYADAFIEWAVYTAGTRYAFSTEKINQLVDYYLDGICKMMVYGKYPDPGARNRAVSRIGALNPMGPGAAEDLLKTSDYRKNELEEIAGVRRGKIKSSSSHNAFFWHSEYMSHQQPAYFASVRMFSSRNHNMEEPYNSEGLKNHHLGDGSNFISRTGKEYHDIYPVLDWQKIPGTTVMQKPELPSDSEIQKPGSTDFVGGVTNGTVGAAAFDFRSPHDLLKARKAWFFFDDQYVCLGAGIVCNSRFPVATTLNQCYLNGPVVAMQNNRRRVMENGDHELDEVKWILHDSIGYVFAGPAKAYLKNSVATGSWWDINHQSDTPKDQVSKDVFKLWIDHGIRPRDMSYEYIVVPSISEQQIESRAADIEIIANTPDLQAVKNKRSNIVQAVFYKAGEVRISDSLILGCESPGMVMARIEGDKVAEISVSDPNRELRSLHLTISTRLESNGQGFRSVWNERKGVSEIAFELPQNEYAGKSITVKAMEM